MANTALPAHQARSRETLERLFKATADTLNSEGLDAATIPQIAMRAGVTPGAIYRRFPDKDTLLRAVCLRLLNENYRQTKERLKPEHWRDAALAEICDWIIKAMVKGYTRQRGLLRALTFFTMQHADAAFIRKSEELQWRVFRDVAELLLTRTNEMRHPDPEAAVPLVLLTVGNTIKGLLVLPRNPQQFSRFVPDLERRLQEELPKMILSYLGID